MKQILSLCEEETTGGEREGGCKRLFVVFAGRLAAPAASGLSSATVEGAGKTGIGEGPDASPVEPERRGRRGSCQRDPKQPSVSSKKKKRTGGWGEKIAVWM
jgi:hypothetical protein